MYLIILLIHFWIVLILFAQKEFSIFPAESVN